MFKSDDGAVQKYNLGRGYWKFIGQGTLPNPAAAVGMDIVKEHAHELESAFRIPHNQRGTEVTTSVRSTAQQGTSHVIAHHVRLLRTINGLRVWDSHFMLTAGLDGTPFRVEHRWPTFRLDESRLVADAEDVAQRFAELLGDGFQDAGLRAQLVYYFDEASGYHEPVAMLEATRESVPTPEIASISLTTGTIGQLGGKTSEEADDGDE